MRPGRRTVAKHRRIVSFITLLLLVEMFRHHSLVVLHLVWPDFRIVPEEELRVRSTRVYLRDFGRVPELSRVFNHRPRQIMPRALPRAEPVLQIEIRLWFVA